MSVKFQGQFQITGISKESSIQWFLQANITYTGNPALGFGAADVQVGDIIVVLSSNPSGQLHRLSVSEIVSVVDADTIQLRMVYDGNNAPPTTIASGTGIITRRSDGDQEVSLTPSFLWCQVSEYLSSFVSSDATDRDKKTARQITGQINGLNAPDPTLTPNQTFIVTRSSSLSSSSGSSGTVFLEKEIYQSLGGIWVIVNVFNGLLMDVTMPLTGNVDEYKENSLYQWDTNESIWTLIGPQDAINVFFDNSTTDLSSTNVQNVIEELNDKIDPVTYIVNGQIDDPNNPPVANEGDIYIITVAASSSSSSANFYQLNQIYQYINGEWILIDNSDGSQISVSENLTGGTVEYDDNSIYVFDETGDTWNLVGPQEAIDVTYDNSTSGLTSTDVQNAIDELNTNDQTINNGSAPVYIVTGEITGAVPDPASSPGEIFIVTGSLSSSSSSGMFDLKSLYRSDGTQWILITSFEGAQINVTDALSGGTDTYVADSAYMWNEDGLEWTQIGGGVGINMIRENIYTDGPARIHVFASSPNLTSGITVVKGTSGGMPLFSFSIPIGVRLISATLLLDQANGDYNGFGQARVDFGTNDMPNNSLQNRWVPTVQGWIASTGINIEDTIRINFVTGTFTMSEIVSMDTGTGQSLIKLDF